VELSSCFCMQGMQLQESLFHPRQAPQLSPELARDRRNRAWPQHQVLNGNNPNSNLLPDEAHRSECVLILCCSVGDNNHDHTIHPRLDCEQVEAILRPAAQRELIVTIRTSYLTGQSVRSGYLTNRMPPLRSGS